MNVVMVLFFFQEILFLALKNSAIEKQKLTGHKKNVISFKSGFLFSEFPAE